MKERIYTIPVTEAFGEDCECPMCLLEKRFEDQKIEYFLGPSLMEPDCRVETNEKGFCKRHFEIMYNSKKNILGLGLMLETHLDSVNTKLQKLFGYGAGPLRREMEASFFKNLTMKLSTGKTASGQCIDSLIAALDQLEKKCAICDQLDYVMDRYVDVILYLWCKESDFRKLFDSKKGFCLKHLKLLLEGVKKYLSGREASELVHNLMKIQLQNMKRIQEEVIWFTQKFDYRNHDLPWGNSKDAVPRSIQKIVGYSDLK